MVTELNVTGLLASKVISPLYVPPVMVTDELAVILPVSCTLVTLTELLLLVRLPCTTPVFKVILPPVVMLPYSAILLSVTFELLAVILPYKVVVWVHPENRYLNGFSDTISPKIAS